MLGFIKKHPLVTAAAALGGWYFFFGPGSKKASAQPPAPGPAPANTFQDVIVIQPGALPESIPRGGEMVLQLPLGAAWAQGTAVTQAPSSQIGGTVDPVQPVGAEQQSWRNLSGQGTIIAQWMDQYGNPQTTTVALTTT
jgi:hypothetical protein